MAHEKFHSQSLDEVKAKAEELGLNLPFAKETGILKTPLTA